MAFNVDAFRRNLVKDGARPNLFEVNVPFIGGGSDPAFRFMCKTAALPGSTVGVIEVPYFGRAVKVAGNRTFAEWTVTVINDEGFGLRNKFEAWHSRLSGNANNIRTVGNSLQNSGYTTDAKVTHFGKGGNEIKSYIFHGLFPSDISQIDLDWGSNDTLEEFTVTLSYQYWTDARVSNAAQVSTTSDTSAAAAAVSDGSAIPTSTQA